MHNKVSGMNEMMLDTRCWLLDVNILFFYLVSSLQYLVSVICNKQETNHEDSFSAG